jgi:hypothetical protein
MTVALQPWMEVTRWHVPSNYWLTFNRLHSVIPHKTELFHFRFVYFFPGETLKIILNQIWQMFSPWSKKCYWFHWWTCWYMPNIASHTISLFGKTSLPQQEFWLGNPSTVISLTKSYHLWLFLFLWHWRVKLYNNKIACLSPSLQADAQTFSIGCHTDILKQLYLQYPLPPFLLLLLGHVPISHSNLHISCLRPETNESLIHMYPYSHLWKCVII